MFKMLYAKIKYCENLQILWNYVLIWECMLWKINYLFAAKIIHLNEACLFVVFISILVYSLEEIIRGNIGAKYKITNMKI